MMSNGLIPPSFNIENQTLKITGHITHDFVVKLWKQGLHAIQTISNTTLYVDLTGLLQSDSSSLALWSSWMRAALRQGKTLYFINIPAFMQDLIRVHELQTLLPQALLSTEV